MRGLYVSHGGGLLGELRQPRAAGQDIRKQALGLIALQDVDVHRTIQLADQLVRYRLVSRREGP